MSATATRNGLWVCYGCKAARRRKAGRPSEFIDGKVESFHAACWERYREERALAVIDRHFPAGRPVPILDTIFERGRAGASVASLARDYDQAPELVLAVLVGWRR